jgi:hypothetical protein
VASFPILFLLKGASPFCPTSESEKKKGLKNKDAIFFSRDYIYGLIPIYGGINKWNLAGRDLSLAYACIISLDRHRRLM